MIMNRSNSDLAKTSLEEFSRWLDLIPKKLHDRLFLLPIRRHGKSPDVPKDESWKDHRLTIDEAIERLIQGKNVAYSPRMEMVVYDIDDPERARKYLEDGFTQGTLTVSTRSDKPHVYFLNSIGVQNGEISEEVDGEREKIIEARANWRYVLVPGSYVPSERGSGLYEVGFQEQHPPAEIREEALPEKLKPRPEKSVEDSHPDFDGDYISLPCVRKLFKTKLPVGGRRRKAGKFLSIAWEQDNGGDVDGFKRWIRPFAEFQDRGHRHRPSEYSWLGRGDKLDWNCKEVRNYLSEFTTVPCGRCRMEVS